MIIVPTNLFEATEPISSTCILFLSAHILGGDECVYCFVSDTQTIQTVWGRGSSPSVGIRLGTPVAAQKIRSFRASSRVDEYCVPAVFCLLFFQGVCHISKIRGTFSRLDISLPTFGILRHLVFCLWQKICLRMTIQLLRRWCNKQINPSPPAPLASSPETNASCSSSYPVHSLTLLQQTGPEKALTGLESLIHFSSD